MKHLPTQPSLFQSPCICPSLDGRRFFDQDEHENLDEISLAHGEPFQKRFEVGRDERVCEASRGARNVPLPRHGGAGFAVTTAKMPYIFGLRAPKDGATKHQTDVCILHEIVAIATMTTVSVVETMP